MRFGSPLIAKFHWPLWCWVVLCFAGVCLVFSVSLRLRVFSSGPTMPCSLGRAGEKKTFEALEL